METDSLDPLIHDHGPPATVGRHETRTRWVVALTAAMMVGELVVGTLTHSLALTADGWHMATHAGALGMTAFAYWFARTRARASAFTFGTGKVNALAGYTSSIVLALVAFAMIVESGRRLLHPESIRFEEALPVAVLGLVVNLASMKLLHPGEAVGASGGHDHSHDHSHGHGSGGEQANGHGHGHGHGHGADHNLRSAYLHVLADAMTSVLAIGALLGGRYMGWTFLDPMMGVVGAVVILRWSWGLCWSAARVLLDVAPSDKLVEAVRQRVESLDDARVVDLHVWDVGTGRLGCIVSLVTSRPRKPLYYRAAIHEQFPFAHVTVEVHPREAADDATVPEGFEPRPRFKMRPRSRAPRV